MYVGSTRTDEEDDVLEAMMTAQQQLLAKGPSLSDIQQGSSTDNLLQALDIDSSFLNEMQKEASNTMREIIGELPVNLHPGGRETVLVSTDDVGSEPPYMQATGLEVEDGDGIDEQEDGFSMEDIDSGLEPDQREIAQKTFQQLLKTSMDLASTEEASPGVARETVETGAC